MGAVSNQKKIQHVFSRAAFGISPAELEKRKGQQVSEAVEELFRESAHFSDLSIVQSDQLEAMTATERKNLTQEERKKRREEKRRSLQDLTIAWTERLWKDPARLRERMTFFWHGHFACRLEAPLALQELNNIHRRHALGSFRDMLMEVSKSPAMLQFLNNQQNRKMHPNENFAREVMELFTLGRGNYTENDIKEGARAFTGWGFEMPGGQFVFRDKQHDDGEKNFLGKTGNFKGEDIITMLLDKKETAVYISRKVYRFFVNDVENESHIQELATIFYASGYRIDVLMKKLFSSDWFYDEEHIGVKIKSPVDLLVSMNRMMPVQYENKDGLLFFQRSLGQALFFPPNVSGWAGGKSWIDSSSLMFRLKAPSLVLNKGNIDLVPKEVLPESRHQMADTAMQQEKKQGDGEKQKKGFHPEADWTTFLATLPENISREELIGKILLPEPSVQLLHCLKELTKTNHREFVMELLSSPEYQMA
jgi:uncharacterized protein (DUF1800 family)